MVTTSTKKIIAVGCSHVYGNYAIDIHTDAEERCHQRSWVNKILKYYADYEYVNLAIPGGSNTRSLRVIKEYVLNNLKSLNGSIIFFGITAISRTEFPSYQYLNIQDSYDQAKNYNINKVGPWMEINNKPLNKFLKLYYGMFYVDEYTKLQLSLDLITLHTFLKHLDIEHYFVGMLITEDILDEYCKTFNLPTILWRNGAIDYAKENGFKVGKDVYPNTNCNHLNHDGNIFLAEQIYQKITEIKNAK